MPKWNSYKKLPFRQNIIPFQITDRWEWQAANYVDGRLCGQWPHYKTLIILASAVHCACVLSGAVCNMQWKCAVWSVWCTKVRIGVWQNKIPFQTLIDEIEKQLTTTWTVDFVDSKPYYKTLVILPYAVHCACVLWGAVCKMQKQYAVWSMRFT